MEARTTAFGAEDVRTCTAPHVRHALLGHAEPRCPDGDGGRAGVKRAAASDPRAAPPRENN
eukprot:15010602-Alexandrium_andersonii.AAC.1